MIEDKGYIVSIDKLAGIGVKVEGVENCEVCALKSNCGQSRGEVLYLPYKEGFDIGDYVRIRVHSISLFNASLFIYIFPLIIFIGGILISYFYIFKSMDEILRATLSFFVSILILIPYGIFLRIYDKKKQKQIIYEIEKIS